MRTQHDKAGAKKAEGEVGCCESSQSKDEHGGEIMKEERTRFFDKARRGGREIFDRRILSRNRLGCGMYKGSVEGEKYEDVHQHLWLYA